MGKKTRGSKNKNKRKASASPSSALLITEPEVTIAATRPKIQPGRIALVRNLKNRKYLNGEFVTIKHTLPDARVAVVVTHTEPEKREETVSIKPANLEVSHRKFGLEPWEQTETCPICMDTEMVTQTTSIPRNATSYVCCGKKVCFKCRNEMLKQKASTIADRCPMCNSKVAFTEAETVAQVRTRASRGDPVAMRHLAESYRYGRMGLPQNEAMARSWFGRAAEKGEARAAHSFAEFHEKGIGGPVNHPEAARWFRVTSDLGGVNATTCLGRMYASGVGVDRDFEMAKKLLKRSMDAGDEQAKAYHEKVSFIMSAPPMVQVILSRQIW